MSDTTKPGDTPFNPALVTQDDYSEMNPQVAIRIMVDTTAILLHASNDVVDRGIYMIDNKAEFGSASEGTMQLNTHGRPRDWVAWYIDPIDLTLGDHVAIIGFETVSGDAWGDDDPAYLAASVDLPGGPYWIARIDNASNMRYRIRCKLVTGGANRREVIFRWDPYITVVG